MRSTGRGVIVKGLLVVLDRLIHTTCRRLSIKIAQVLMILIGTILRTLGIAVLVARKPKNLVHRLGSHNRRTYIPYNRSKTVFKIAEQSLRG